MLDEPAHPPALPIEEPLDGSYDGERYWPRNEFYLIAAELVVLLLVTVFLCFSNFESISLLWTHSLGRKMLLGGCMYFLVGSGAFVGASMLLRLLLLPTNMQLVDEEDDFALQLLLALLQIIFVFLPTLCAYFWLARPSSGLL